MPAKATRGTQTPTHSGLSIDSIVEATCDLIAEHGVAKLTMRGLSDRLGVALGATYRHVPNRQALLDLAVRELLRRVADQSAPAADWLDRLRALSLGFIDVFGSHPGTAEYLMSRLGSIVVPELAALQVGIDAESGLDPVSAANAGMAVFFYVGGVAASDLLGRDPADRRHYEGGLEVLLKGVAAEAAEARRRADVPGLGPAVPAGQ